MTLRPDAAWDRKRWDVYWPTNALRYGRDCRQCGKLLTRDETVVCQFCRADFARARQEGTRVAP